MIKVVADECPDVGAYLAGMAGTAVDDVSVSKKVMKLHSPAAITLCVNYWAELICEHQQKLNKTVVAVNLRHQIPKFLSAIAKFEMAVSFKPATAIYFNAVIAKWVQTNKDLSLRTPLDFVADSLTSQYVTMASVLEKQQKPTQDETSKRNNEKFKPQAAKRQFVRAKANFERTNSGEIICRNFNYGRCNFKPCLYKHICNQCGVGNHPAFECKKQSTNPAPNTKPKA